MQADNDIEARQRRTYRAPVAVTLIVSNSSPVSFGTVAGLPNFSLSAFKMEISGPFTAGSNRSLLAEKRVGPQQASCSARKARETLKSVGESFQ